MANTGGEPSATHGRPQPSREVRRIVDENPPSSVDHRHSEELTTQPEWEKAMKQHFQGIFAKKQPEEVQGKLRNIWDQLTRTCKQTRWRPFSREELAACAEAWAFGKSTGPDGISYEALRVMRMHESWEPRIREQFNDALYKGRCDQLDKKSATILIPKEMQPKEWGGPDPSHSAVARTTVARKSSRGDHVEGEVPVCQTRQAGDRADTYPS